MKLPKPKLDERDFLTICYLVQTALWLLMLPCVIGLFFLYRDLTDGPTNTLVQLAEGTAFVGEPKSANYRSPEVVKRYVEDWVKTAFTWSGNLGAEGTNVLHDEGISIPGIGLAPTNLVNASFAWADGKRMTFLENFLQEGWVPEDYFSVEPTTTVVQIDILGEPLLLDPDEQTYSVKVVASINKIKDGNPIGEVDYYRQELILTSIPIPRHRPGDQAILMEKLAYEWRRRGLLIKHTNPLPLYTTK